MDRRSCIMSAIRVAILTSQLDDLRLRKHILMRNAMQSAIPLRQMLTQTSLVQSFNTSFKNEDSTASHRPSYLMTKPRSNYLSKAVVNCAMLTGSSQLEGPVLAFETGLLRSN